MAVKDERLHTNKEGLPGWANEFRLKFSSSVAHVFLLTGNVRDVVKNRMLIDTFLSKMFLSPTPDGIQHFDLVIFYDRAAGIHFPLDAMEQIFRKEAGLASVAAKPDATQGMFKPAEAQTRALPRDPKEAFDLIDLVLHSDRTQTITDKETGKQKQVPLHTALIIDYAQTIIPAGSMASMLDDDRYCLVKILNWARDAKLSANGIPIILLADSSAQLNDAVTASSSRIESLEILLPSPEERKAFIDFLAEDREKPLAFAKGFNAQQFANVSSGLKKINLEDIKMTAGKRGLPISAELVKDRKAEIFKTEYQSQIEVIDPDFGFETVGGYQWVKDYLMLDVVEPMLSGDTARVPMGLLFTGAPGTGKTVLARALAYEAGMNMLVLDIGKVMGSLVGQSEHNMARVMLAARSFVPVLIFLDEIDQSASRGSHGDSGVSNRIFQSLLQNMSDTTMRGKIVWVGASNRPDMMDAALKRRGRFDKIIPFLPPDTAQRAEIFPAVIRRYGYKTDGTLDFEALAQESVEWVGSDIEAGVIKAYQLARHDKRKEIRQGDLESALKKILPARHDVEKWTNLALLETSDIDLLPPSYRDEFLKSRKQIEAKVRQASRNEIGESVRGERDLF